MATARRRMSRLVLPTAVMLAVSPGAGGGSGAAGTVTITKAAGQPTQERWRPISAAPVPGRGTDGLQSVWAGTRMRPRRTSASPGQDTLATGFLGCVSENRRSVESERAADAACRP